MVQKIVFHLGDYKTGSTSIQQVLLRRDWRCPGRSVAYPTRLNHRALAACLYEPAETPRRAKRFEALAGKIRAARADTVVISDETFEDVSPDLLMQMLRAHMPELIEHMHFIAYVRPHAERTLSSYTQIRKLGMFTGNLEAFHNYTMKQKRLFYTPRFSHWQQVFGARFSLRPMVRAHLYQGDVVADFFHYLFDGQPFELTGTPTSNASLGIRHLSMLRAFHKLERATPYEALADTRSKAAWHLSRVLEEATPPGAEKLQLHRDLAERIASDYRTDAEALDAAFFGEPILAPVLARSVEASVEEPMSLAFIDHFDADQRRLLKVLMQLSDDLLARNPEDWRGYFRKIWADSLQPGRDTAPDSTPDSAPDSAPDGPPQSGDAT